MNWFNEKVESLADLMLTVILLLLFFCATMALVLAIWFSVAFLINSSSQKHSVESVEAVENGTLRGDGL